MFSETICNGKCDIFGNEESLASTSSLKDRRSAKTCLERGVSREYVVPLIQRRSDSNLDEHEAVVNVLKSD